MEALQLGKQRRKRIERFEERLKPDVEKNVPRGVWGLRPPPPPLTYHRAFMPLSWFSRLKFLPGKHVFEEHGNYVCTDTEQHPGHSK